MTQNFELAGSVKPYYGGSSQKRIPGGTNPVAEAVGNPSPVTPVIPPDDAAMEIGSDIVLEEIVYLKPGPEEIVRGVCQSEGWLTTESQGSLDAVVQVAGDRTQIVKIGFQEFDESGRSLITFRSFCGPAGRRNAVALLKRNARLTRAAFAIDKVGNEDVVVLRACKVADQATADECESIILMVAQLADSIEQKLVGTDEF